MKDELIRTEEENNKNSNGFIYVLKNPSLKGMVKIGATTKAPSKKCEELSSTSTIPTPFNIVYSKPSMNPFKAVSLVHAILDEYRVYKNSDFFNVDVDPTIDLIDDIATMMEDFICRKNSTPKVTYTSLAEIPFGKGYGERKAIWKALMMRISQLKYNIIFISHIIENTVDDGSDELRKF